MKRKIIKIVIIGLFVLGILAILICNWSGVLSANATSYLPFYTDHFYMNLPSKNPDRFDVKLNEIFNQYNFFYYATEYYRGAFTFNDIYLSFEPTDKSLWMQWLARDTGEGYNIRITDEFETQELEMMYIVQVANSTAVDNGFVEISVVDWNSNATLGILDNTGIYAAAPYKLSNRKWGLSIFLGTAGNVDAYLDENSGTKYAVPWVTLEFAFKSGYDFFPEQEKIYQLDAIAQSNKRFVDYWVTDAYDTIDYTEDLKPDQLNYFINYYGQNDYFSGYNRGFNDGIDYDDGSNQEAYATGYNEGYTFGYNSGYYDGQNAQSNTTTPIESAAYLVRAALTALDVKLFGIISILDIIGIVVILALVLFIVKLIRS